MELFVIIYSIAVGGVGGFAGPLPYDMKECERRVYKMNRRVDRFSNRNPLHSAAYALKFRCEYRASLPVVRHRKKVKSF